MAIAIFMEICPATNIFRNNLTKKHFVQYDKAVRYSEEVGKLGVFPLCPTLLLGAYCSCCSELHLQLSGMTFLTPVSYNTSSTRCQTIPYRSQLSLHALCSISCVQFLNSWVQKIRGLGVGELVMAPCGWMRADGTGHSVVFVVMRQAADFFSVSIVNPCGEGSEYHVQEADPFGGKVRVAIFCLCRQ